MTEEKPTMNPTASTKTITKLLFTISLIPPYLKLYAAPAIKASATAALTLAFS